MKSKFSNTAYNAKTAMKRNERKVNPNELKSFANFALHCVHSVIES
jgi:hypothetical protein